MPVAVGHSELLVQLLRDARYSAPYLRETIDWIERSARADAAACAGFMEAVVCAIEDYAAGAGPGAGEIAQRLADARHALALISRDHYAMLPLGAPPVPEEPVRRVQLLRLAVAAGRTRVSAESDGAVVVATSQGRTVFRPLEPGDAHGLQIASRQLREAARQRAIVVQELLSRHVRLADWADAQPEGVTVEAKGGQVTVSWWSADPCSPVGPWLKGGVRDLCQALLEHHGHSVRRAADDAIEVLG